MERLKHIEDKLINEIEHSMSDMKSVDTNELGEAIDMIKDLEQAIYYCTMALAELEKLESEE